MYQKGIGELYVTSSYAPRSFGTDNKRLLLYIIGFINFYLLTDDVKYLRKFCYRRNMHSI